MTLIPIKSITPQRVPGNTTLSRLWLKRSPLMFASSESPQKGLSSRCRHLANGNSVWIRSWWLFSCDLWQDSNFTLLQPFSCRNWRPCVISPSAGATLEPRPLSSRSQKARLHPLSSRDPQPRAYRQRHPTRLGSRWTLTSSFPVMRSQHTRVVCLP